MTVTLKTGTRQTVTQKAGPKTTHTMDVADLILALCDAGEWELAVKLARQQDETRAGPR